MKYKVEIKETLVREVEIEAESKADAEQKIEDKWKNEEIVLSADDFSFVNYTASPVIQKVKYTLYQLKNTEENHYIRFMGLSSAISSQINLNNYDKVYDGEYSIYEPFNANTICESLFEKFNIKPEESYFIDDLQLNIDGAAACGMKGYCFADGNVEKLQKALESLKKDS